jgi:regulatory protein
MREHSTAELSSKLAQKFDKSELVPSVIEQVTEDGYLSDERFTEAYVRMRQGRGFGPVKIRSELMNRSVSNTLIDEYLDQRAALWLNIAEDQYLKKFGQTKVKDYKDWSRRARFLQSRGFNRDHIDLTVPRETKDYLD